MYLSGFLFQLWDFCLPLFSFSYFLLTCSLLTPHCYFLLWDWITKASLRLWTHKLSVYLSIFFSLLPWHDFISTFYPPPLEWDPYGFDRRLAIIFFLPSTLQPVYSDFLPQSLQYECFSQFRHLFISLSISHSHETLWPKLLSFFKNNFAPSIPPSYSLSLSCNLPMRKKKTVFVQFVISQSVSCWSHLKHLSYCCASVLRPLFPLSFVPSHITPPSFTDHRATFPLFIPSALHQPRPCHDEL